MKNITHQRLKLLIPQAQQPISDPYTPDSEESIALDNLKDRLHSCGTLLKLKYHCHECYKIHTDYKRANCGIRFAPCCASHRFNKSFARFNEYGIRSKKLLHVVIGFPRATGGIREQKKWLDYVTDELSRDLKKSGYRLKGFKVFDMADQDAPYLHYHLGLQQFMWLDYRKLMRIRKKTIERTGQEFVVRVIGMRTRSRLYRYFSMRAAGLFGHSEEKFIDHETAAGKSDPLFYGYTLADVMDVQSFQDTVMRYRAVTVLGRLKRLSCIVGPVSLRKCVFCGSEFIETTVTAHLDNREPQKPRFIGGSIPPPRAGDSPELREFLIQARRDHRDHIKSCLDLEREFLKGDDDDDADPEGEEPDPDIMPDVIRPPNPRL